MNKYLVIIGEIPFQRWGGEYAAYSNKSIAELENDEKFLAAVDEALVDLYYEYGEDDESEEDFVNDGGICEIREFADTDGNAEILYDER
jgi:hypothetical protein